jgi:putative transposon-encoded protein
VVLPEYPADAEVSFEADVKAFENGATGPKPRNFTKDKVDCPLPE